MATVHEHYAQLLAQHYLWMNGDFDAKVAADRQFFDALDLPPRAGALAVDLGCGPGYQSLALAQAGYRVLAVDTSAALLAELGRHAGAWPIGQVEGDLLDFEAACDEAPALCVCMGDTLSHLPSVEAVAALFQAVARALVAGGALVLTYRDLTVELKDADRFLPVRSDTDTVFTCFLEYEAEQVKVHDVVYTRGEGGWTLHKSWYRKLRLGKTRVIAMLEQAGLQVRQVEARAGMVGLVATKVA